MNCKFDAQKQLITAIPDWMVPVTAIAFMAGCFAAGIRESSMGMITAILAGLSFVHAFCFFEKYLAGVKASCFLLKYDTDIKPRLISQMKFYAVIGVLYWIMLRIGTSIPGLDEISSTESIVLLYAACGGYISLFMINLMIILIMKIIHACFISTGKYEY